MVSQLKVNEIIKQSGSTLTIGQDGDTVSGPFTNLPAFSVQLSGNQDIATSTTTKITWDSENYDTDNAFASNKFTVPTGKAGKYLFEMAISIEYGNGAGEYGDLKLRKNGSNFRESRRAVSGNASLPQTISLVATIDLLVGDYIEGFIFHNKGTTQAIQAGNFTYFTGHRISA